MKLESIHLYRMVHIDNVPHILAHGITHKHSPHANPNFVKQPTPPEKIVYIAYRLVKVIENGNVYYFSDGHATDRFTTFYDQEKNTIFKP